MEQPLPPYLSCNLGSINLNHKDFFVNGEFDYDELERVIRRTTIFLDNVGTTNTFPNDKFKNKYEQFRPIGLGIMGYADLLLKMKLAYGSQDALDLLAKILDKIQQVSYNESEMLGRLRGVPEKCIHVNRRNITCQSIAPTGSISHIANLLGGGCEPIFSGSFTRIDERGQTYYISHEDNDKEYFRSVIGPKSVSIDEHINTQAVAQQYVDSGVSKTINLPNDATVEDVYQGFIKAWKLGCKGITVYRDGSRTSQVLNNGTEIKKKFSELNPTNLNTSKCGCDNSNVVFAEGCEHCTNCGWSACSIG
jgi:ribonucleoside-diphosphate reductase alpha chain